MNRPFLLIIAFAVLVFITSIAWANSTENMPIWWDIPEPLLSPLAIIFSAFIARKFAILTIQENKKIQKRRVTIEYTSRISWDKDYTDMRKKFLELKAKKIDFSKIAEDYHALPDKKHNATKDKLSAKEQDIINNHNVIRKILNEYETMAVALKMGVYDEDIIKMSKKQIALSDLRTCGTFIGTTRKKLGTKNEYANPEVVYKECCDLYKEWSGKDLETLK